MVYQVPKYNLQPTLELPITHSFQLQFHVKLSYTSKLFSHSRFTITLFNQIAVHSITCLTHYFHPSDIFQLLAPPRLGIQNTTTMNSFFTTKKVKDGKVDIFLSILVHIHFSRMSNSELKEESHNKSCNSLKFCSATWRFV